MFYFIFRYKEDRRKQLAAQENINSFIESTVFDLLFSPKKRKDVKNSLKNKCFMQYIILELLI